MRAKLATIEFKRRIDAPERAIGQLATVVRVVERDHFQFGITQQIVEGATRPSVFSSRRGPSPSFFVTIAALMPAAPAPMMITSTS